MDQTFSLVFIIFYLLMKIQTNCSILFLFPYFLNKCNLNPHYSTNLFLLLCNFNLEYASYFHNLQLINQVNYFKLAIHPIPYYSNNMGLYPLFALQSDEIHLSFHFLDSNHQQITYHN